MNKNNKSKIEGVDNKELMIFVVIIVIVIILVLFEMFFFEGRESVKQDQIAVQEQLDAMQSVTVEAEQKTVYHALNDIVEMMNEKDYQGLYDRLKDDYKSYYFSDYNDFKNFMDVYAEKRYYAKYNSYYRANGLYYIMVDFLQDKYTREDLLSQRTVKVDTIVLEETKDGEFKFAMNGFIENIAHNKSKTVKDVTFTLANSIRNVETMETTVFISNNSKKALTISSSDIYPEVYGGNSAKTSLSSMLSLKPGEVGTLSIEYYFGYNDDKELRGINIREVKFDDGTTIKDVYVAK